MSRIKKLETHYHEQLKEKDIKDISEFIQSIVDADITKGKYARFLIESFLNDKFLEEDLMGELESTIGQAISLFDKHKGKLPINERSVYALDEETGEALYQSPGDLWNSVKQFQDEKSGKELKKEEQEQIYRETEFIYKDEDTGFQIISPLTEESAKWWGKGTRWCTSADNNNQFENYAEKAPLFILLMPNGDKLQLWKNDNRIQFMNEADNTVSLDYIEKNWNILEQICLWLNDLQYIPKVYLTQELCELAVKNNGFALSEVPYNFKTEELCNMAVKQNGMALRYIPEQYRTKELCELAVNQNGFALEYIPEYLKNKKIYLDAVKSEGESLGNIPKDFKTEELCKIAVQQNGVAIMFVPDKYKTEELYELAIEKNGNTLCFIFNGVRTKELCELAIQQNGYALRYVPEHLKTKELCEMAVQQNGWSLQFIPEDLRTKEICELAIKRNKEALKYVPEKWKEKMKNYIIDTPTKIPEDIYQKYFKELRGVFLKKHCKKHYM